MSNLLLDLDELKTDHERKAKNKIRLFDEILTSCHNKIKKYSKEFKKQECLFSPPQFVMGRPPYDYEQLIDYLLTSLSNNGLFAEWIPDRSSIYISWKPEDINLETYQKTLKSTSYTDNFDTEFTVVKPKAKAQTKQKQVRTQGRATAVTGTATVEYNGAAKDRVPVNIRRIK